MTYFIHIFGKEKKKRKEVFLFPSPFEKKYFLYCILFYSIKKKKKVRAKKLHKGREKGGGELLFWNKKAVVRPPTAWPPFFFSQDNFPFET